MWKQNYPELSIDISKSLNKETIVAILCADLHLSSTPPIWRSNEPDWWAAMARPLSQIRQLQRYFDCPVICAGDIFDKWNSSPELINFAMQYLPNPRLYFVFGQHDLPDHNLKEITRSATYTLWASGKMFPFMDPALLCNAFFNYGQKIERQQFDRPTVCIAHQYQWIKGHSYVTAPQNSFMNKEKLKKLGYKVYVFGDNHCGFHIEFDGITVFNCGSLMRRRSDQKNYKPMVGLLTNKMKVIPYYLDTSQDVHIRHLDEVDAEIEKREGVNMDLVISQLLKLGTCSVDFCKAVEQITQSESVDQNVLSILRKAMQ